MYEGMNSKLHPQLFATVAQLMNKKHHLTPEGIEAIRILKEDVKRDSLDAGNPHVQWGGTGF